MINNHNIRRILDTGQAYYFTNQDYGGARDNDTAIALEENKLFERHRWTKRPNGILYRAVKIQE